MKIPAYVAVIIVRIYCETWRKFYLKIILLTVTDNILQSQSSKSSTLLANAIILCNPKESKHHNQFASKKTSPATANN